MSELTVRIVGTPGDGVISFGDIFTLASARAGMYVTTHRSFPTEIRGGGQSLFQFKVSSQKVLTVGDKVDVLIAFNEETLRDNISILKDDGVLIFDSSECAKRFDEYINIHKYFIPISKMAEEKASSKAKNMIAIGLFMGLLSKINIKEEIIDDIKRKFSSKDEKIVKANLDAFEYALDYAKENLTKVNFLENLEIKKTGKKIIMTGNEAIALAALTAGCRFYSGYPITPATDIMEFLALEMPKLGGSVIQCEDEIASITAAIGASYAGKKAMTATSGPGMSLMSEALGLASMAEIPLVVVDVQRGGPSTGLPTKGEQSDLNFAIYGTHGDTPKIVIAPINVEDCFYQTINAFNYAETYQVPVILLSDAVLAEKRECIDAIDFDSIKIVERLRYKYKEESKEDLFNRYLSTNTGISPVSIPGDFGGEYVATGLEHTEYSAPSNAPKIHAQMTEKRFKKLETAVNDFSVAKKYGSDGAKIGIISWGSTSGAVLEAIDMASEHGYMVQALYPRTVYPFPNNWINDFLVNKEILLIVERNYSAQFANTIVYRCTCMNKDLKIYNFMKYDGELFTSQEVFDKIDEIVKSQALKFINGKYGITIA